MGRTKQFEKRITLPMSADQLDRADSVLNGGEPRLDMIREAVDREIERRERQIKLNGRKPPSTPQA